MEQGKDRLAARGLLYRLAQSLLSEPPTKESVELALSDLAEEALVICDVPIDAPRRDADRAAFAAAPNEFTQSVDDQYQRLFYQPGKLPCPPWESSYVSGERKVFQQSTLDVRRAYQAQGLRPHAVNRIPDDHIAIELGFMAELAKRMQGNDVDAGERSLQASANFLNEHLSRWVDAYAHDVVSADNVPFFAQVCAAVQVFVREDMRFIAELLSTRQLTSAGALSA